MCEQIGKRFGLAAEEALSLENLVVFGSLALFLQMIERRDQKAAGAAGWIEEGFAQSWVGDGDHETDNSARGVEFAGIPGGVAHFFEHGLVEMAEGVDFVGRGEVDAVHFVDDVSQEVAVDHAVDGAFEDGGNHVAAVAAIGSLQAAQVGEEAGAFLAVRTTGFVVVHELDQFVAGDAVGLGGPIAPAVGRFDGVTEAFAGQLRVGLADLLQIVEELQEHDPGEHRQTVEVAIESFVLAHDVARRLDQAAELLGSGYRGLRFHISDLRHGIINFR